MRTRRLNFFSRTVALLLLASAASACAPDRAPRPSMEFPVPSQLPLALAAEPVLLEAGKWLEPKWYYEVDAYVLSVAEYSRGHLSDVSSRDLVLAWGPVAKPQNIHGIKVTQAERGFEWKAVDEALFRNIGPKALGLAMANTLVIGANPLATKQLDSVRPGDALRARGYLVDVKTRESTVFAKSSIKRDDKGAGSSEIFYVTSAEVLDPGF